MPWRPNTQGGKYPSLTHFCAPAPLANLSILVVLGSLDRLGCSLACVLA